MKKYYFIVMTCCALAMAQSCKKASFLDPKIEPLTEAKVFADSTLTLNFLTDMYAYTGMDIVPYASTYLGSMNDNFETLTTNVSAGYSSSPQIPLLTSSLTSNSHLFNAYYLAYYKKIRAANIFMKNAPSSPLSAARKTRLIAEARFMRAWYYFALVRLYGGVQLMGDEVTDELPSYEYKRNTYKECIDYVVKELDEAVKNLPTSLVLEASDYGRVTSGACKALKARVLVTAASPLYNGKSTGTGSIVPLIAYSPTYDQSLWQKAADACKAVLDLPEYALVEDNTTQPGLGFKNMFILDRKNTEYIFVFNKGNSKELETMWFPWSRSGISNSLAYSNPSENVVKAFGMKDGKAITASSSAYPYNPANPYANRDPRFDNSIIYNQALVCNRTTTAMQPVDIYFNKATNALTGDGILQYHTNTGYYSRKMCNDIAPYATLSIKRAYPMIRLAEAVLGYAEALNELGQTELAVAQVIKIRKRAGILAGADNRYGIAVGINQTDLRTLIQNEYRVEFFQEGHWYYDTRRWRTAEVTEKQSVDATYIVKELDGTFTYSTRVYINSAFQNTMYFAPFPLSEVLKGKGSLIQNPGW